MGTAGQERYHTLATIYYRAAAAAVVIYDIITMVFFSEQRNGSKNYKDKATSLSYNSVLGLFGPKLEADAPDSTDGVLSNEDFQRIKELKAKKDAKLALFHHGLLKKSSDLKSTVFKVPTSNQLSLKRVDGVTLEANIRKKMTKEERKALIKAGREDSVKYQA